MTGLREAHTLKDRGASNISTGDFVLIYEDNVKRGLWKVGIVEELIAGTDGHVRGAKVRKPGRGKPEIVNCPIQKLFRWKVQVLDARGVLIKGFRRERTK